MGNCLKKESQAEWGGEDWEFLAPKKPTPPPRPETDARRRRRKENKCKTVHFDTRVAVFGGGEEELKVEEKKTNKVVEQVTIRITKKQLEELLGKVELESLSVHDMMTCLVSKHVNDDDQCHEDAYDDQKTWRPISTTIADPDL